MFLTEEKKKSGSDEVKPEEQAATKIQAAFRGHQTRKTMSMKAVSKKPEAVSKKPEAVSKKAEPVSKNPEPEPSKAELEAEFRADDKGKSFI